MARIDLIKDMHETNVLDALERALVRTQDFENVKANFNRNSFIPTDNEKQLSLIQQVIDGYNEHFDNYQGLLTYVLKVAMMVEEEIEQYLDEMNEYYEKEEAENKE